MIPGDEQQRLHKGLFLTALLFLAVDIALLIWAYVDKIWSW